jgi:hypothetical protein
MAESIKLQPEEMQKLQDIQARYQDRIFKFGQFYLERLALDERIKQLADAENANKEEYLNLQKEEQQWMNDISSKYGDGNLSLKDGTFTPVDKSV